MSSGSVAPWLSAVGALLTGVAALTALALVGWSEARKLRSQHRHEERRKLRALIGRHHGPLLEAALDWDRRMHQLYVSPPADPDYYGHDAEGLSELEWFLSDPNYFGTDAWIYGKFCDPDEYVFRSYVFRFLGLCSQARQFEAEAFYVDSQVARKQDFQFLKYAKAFLWAPTNGELHPDDVPAVDHFPNDEFRPILDTCTPGLPADTQADRDRIFDLARLDSLVAKERRLYADRLRRARQRWETEQQRPEPAGDEHGDDHGEGSGQPKAEAHDGTRFIPPHPRGIGQVILFFIGLRRPSWRDGEQARLTRYNWDRLCVLHLLVMAFINEFGYPWQRKSEADIKNAVDAIVDAEVAAKFAGAIPDLGLASSPGHSSRLVIEQLQRRLPTSNGASGEPSLSGRATRR